MEIVKNTNTNDQHTTLIYGVLSYRYRNRAATEAGGEIARERYRKNET